MRSVRRVSLDWVALSSSRTLRADLMAGAIGCFLVLPQAIAFARLAGVPPEIGLYSAIVPCIVAALAGSSWHVTSGPTNANSLALFAMMSTLAVPGTPRYLELVFGVTVLVGVFQFLSGALRIGSIANFISPTALLGFTCGAALLIAWHAVRDLIGAPALAGRAGTLVVAIATAGVALVLKWRWPRSPWMLGGLAGGSLLAWLLNQHAMQWGPGWQVETLGPLPWPLPAFHVPDLSLQDLARIAGIAAALSVVALAQSISIARVIADRSGQRIDANREFVGQGLSNIVGGFFQCYVSCGSLNRSLPNLQAGARTPMAAVFSAVLLVPVVVFSSDWLARIPIAAISALLILVAHALFDVAALRRLLRLSRAESGIALATMLATVTLPLEIAILVGSALSLGHYLQRTSHPAMRTMVIDTRSPHRRFVPIDPAAPLPQCPQLRLLRMEGSVYFGATEHVDGTLRSLRAEHPGQRHLMVMARSMNFVDATGVQLWSSEARERRAMGGGLWFHRPRPHVLGHFGRSGLLEELGEDHIVLSKREGIASITTQMDPDVCARCQVRVFEECRYLPGGTASQATDEGAD